MKPLESQAIEIFVRSTLGCKCPDEVFRDLSIDPNASGDVALRFTRLAVGGRLLIYVLGPQSSDGLRGHIHGLASQGVHERDACGYNRFRLVVATDESLGLEAAVTQAFNMAAGADDRAHVHVVAARDVPAALLPT